MLGTAAIRQAAEGCEIAFGITRRAWLAAGLESALAESTAARIVARIRRFQPDLILSDMAPNTTGHRQTDHLRIVGLIEAAVDFTIEVLRPGGAFLTKAFQGGETSALLTTLKTNFAEVRHVKPKASRAES